MPLVSIIITSYNYESFLQDAIDSALHQTYKETEVIVVDDGSTDNSREIIASYGTRITAVLKEKGGQASAFNAGFSVSQGDIIIFLDSDDQLSPSAAEEAVKVWNPGMSKVHYRLQWIDAQGNLLNTFAPPAGYVLPSGDLKSKILTQGVYHTPPTSGNAFERNFLKTVFPIPEAEWHLCPDAYLHYHAPFYGEIAAIDKPLGYYRVHGANASTITKINKSEIERLSGEIYYRNKCEALIRKEAGRLNLMATPESTVFLVRKLLLLLISPDHYLVKDENLRKLILRGLRAIWRESDIPVWKQIAVSAYFISVPFMTRDMAKRVTFWYIYPEKRPLVIKRLF